MHTLNQPNKNLAFDFIKGQLFEKYVLQCLFSSDHFVLIGRAGYASPGRNPYQPFICDLDFLFLDKRAERKFYVEAKFRKDHFTGEVTWTYYNFVPMQFRVSHSTI
jgi:hypothetical protein